MQTLISFIPFLDRDNDSSRDLGVTCFFGALVHLLLLLAVRIRAADLVPVGDEGPGQVHGSGGEGAAANPEEKADDNHEDILGAFAKGAKPEGCRIGAGDLAVRRKELRPSDHRGVGIVVEGAGGGDDAENGDGPGDVVVICCGDGVGDDLGVEGVEGDAGTGGGGGSKEQENREEERSGTTAEGSHRGLRRGKGQTPAWNGRRQLS